MEQMDTAASSADVTAPGPPPAGAGQPLSESEERFRDIANAAPVLIWITNAHAACIWFNKAVLDFTGGPMAELLGMGFLSVIHPDDCDFVARTFLEIHERRAPIRIQFRARRHDGQWRMLDENAVARFARDGSFMGFIGSCMDITEQHTAHETLRESEERLRLATETAEIGFWDFDVLNGVARPDARVKQMFGMSPDTEATAEEFFALVHEDHRKAVTEAFAAASDPVKRPVYDVEYRVLGRDGVERWIAAKGRGVFDAQGRCVRVIGTAIDITARKIVEQRTHELNEQLEQRVAERTAALEAEAARRSEAEAGLRQAQKMEAIGNLTGGIAHDFNNLLQGVTGSFDLIRRRADDPARVRQWAEAGLLAADRGAKLTAQLLAFSRAQKLELRPLDLALLLSSTHELLARTLGPSVRMRIRVDENLPAVLGDETQLELAVLNLAINARDAMMQGGDLVIAARQRAMAGGGELPRGDYIELSVTDTGDGMAPDVAARAFDPFFTTKDVGRGTGLGLSQVYGMARQAGGAARLRSAPGKGTTVSIFLRLAGGSVAKSAPRDPARDAPQPGAARILVVDDDPGVRRFLDDSLGGLGYCVTLAENGTTGLEMLGRTRPDLMIVDYAMPGMNGAELS